ncbi:MAG: glycine cleavage system protein GcvH [Alphaproteobacteria bacterium]|nr:glycine cleavage system protein GcvH [Alphaproteobacteria bacterium]
MSIPADLRYTESHEWVRVADGVATVGITHHAQDALGDIVHVELPEVGDAVSGGSPCCEVESVKAVSDVYAPVDGEIDAVNEDLDGDEESVNKDPYGQGWLFRVKLTAPGQLGKLMDAKAYAAFLETLDD